MNDFRSSSLRLLGWCLLSLSLSSCVHLGGNESTSRQLDPSKGPWLPENRARLDALLREHGRTSPGYDPQHKPVATFDWDNTMMKNDIGDATVMWALRHDQILQPPDGDWSKTNAHLTVEATSALQSACVGTFPGQPLPTSTNIACAEEILSVYDDGKTTLGQRAWNDETTPTMHQPYAWAAQLFAGHSFDEVKSMARAAYAEGAAAPVGAVQKVGKHEGMPLYLRIYPAMHDLVGSLQENGFDVWVVSASPQPLAEVVAEQVGVAPDHVVGIRQSADAQGKLTADIEPCGTLGPNEVITYDGGKRCWINRAIFKRAEADQLPRSNDPTLHATFAAGDSDTDLAMVQDATALKLVLNRNKVRLMCNAYNNHNGKWLIQPMFIEPFAQHSGNYPCRSTQDALGKPIVDEDGQLLDDVPDTVFALPEAH
jgi:phosphoserine phosphatase